MNSSESTTRIYVALTSEQGESPGEFLKTLEGLPIGVKIGLELFVRRGPKLLEQIKEVGFSLFLDLKFHDIPFTVAGAVCSACQWEPDIMNIHASGGMAMMRAAAEAASGRTKVIAVTILTSLSDDDLSMLGIAGNPGDAVLRMASMVQDAGLDGVVCSPSEAKDVRSAAGEDFLIVTPGVRPAGTSHDDQRRVTTPYKAIFDGSSSLVVGRPITRAENPRKAAVNIFDEIDRALVDRASGQVTDT